MLLFPIFVSVTVKMRNKTETKANEKKEDKQQSVLVASSAPNGEFDVSYLTLHSE